MQDVDVDAGGGALHCGPVGGALHHHQAAWNAAGAGPLRLLLLPMLLLLPLLLLVLRCWVSRWRLLASALRSYILRAWPLQAAGRRRRRRCSSASSGGAAFWNACCHYGLHDGGRGGTPRKLWPKN